MTPPISTGRPPLRLGLVGCGHWGVNLLRELDALPDASVVAVCDTDAGRLDRLRARHPDLTLTASLERLLADPALDAVLVATPPATHHAVARRSLEAGKHVYVEKLLGMTAAEAAELDRLAHRRGRVLMAGHVCIHDAAVERLVEVVRDGAVGPVRHIRAVRVALGRVQTDVNVVWDLAPHDLSILARLLGRYPDEVSVRARSVLGEPEEMANLHLSYDDGPTVDLSLSWLDPVKVRAWTVLGTRGSVVFDALDGEAPLRVVPGAVRRVGLGGGGGFAYESGEASVVSLPRQDGSPLSRLGRHFVDCVLTGSLPVTGGAEGAALLEVLEACDRSLGLGGMAVRVGAVEPSGIVRPAQHGG
jgi:predicted dehydrogenase